jgi:hypothetical protein
VILEVIKHVARQNCLLQIVQRAMNKEGTLLLSTLNHYYAPFYVFNPYHFYEFFPGELLNFIEKYFIVEHFYGQVAGRLVLVPLPWFLLMRAVELLRNAHKFVEINRRAEICRTMIIAAKDNTHHA